jgi:hypothetical protein
MELKGLKGSLTPITDLTTEVENLRKEMERTKKQFYELRGEVWLIKQKGKI